MYIIVEYILAEAKFLRVDTRLRQRVNRDKSHCNLEGLHKLLRINIGRLMNCCEDANYFLAQYIFICNYCSMFNRMIRWNEYDSK